MGVSVPEQGKDYCETFHKIDKGNSAEAKTIWVETGKYYKIDFDLIILLLFIDFSYIPYIHSFLISKSHGWAPKLSYRFYNIGLNNSYVFFKLIHQLHNPGRRMTTMPEVMKEATHALLQRDVTMQTRDPTHPPSVCDLINAYDTHTQAF